MSIPDNYPRILVVALGRINDNDIYNNSLLLRNLFGRDWPRDRLAQIYSSGDTGDRGFFGRYYKLGSNDRMLGGVFYRLRTEAVPGKTKKSTFVQQRSSLHGGWYRGLKSIAKRYLVDTGLYELIFRPRLSAELSAWIEDFQPDVIFAQGYNLTFTLLPLQIKRATGKKLAVLTTDDWPKYQYAGMHGEPNIFRCLVRPALNRAALKLFAESDIPLAFGEPMAEEYNKRYGKSFIPVFHSDNSLRFDICQPKFFHDTSTITIVATGTFNEFRWPLLLDANEACAELNRQGLRVKLVVLSSAIEEDGRRVLAAAQYIKIYQDPGNDELPSYLKGANALLLLEGFDRKFVSAIDLSISSKAHLFMFSRRPIVVYAAAEAGVSKYAANYGWARVVQNRSVSELTVALHQVLIDQNIAFRLVAKADEVLVKHHTHDANQALFLSALKQGV